MTPRNLLVLTAAGGSLLLLLGAFGFQYIGGLSPCHLCLEQRWPHAAAVLIGVLAVLVRGRLLPALGALAAAVTSGLGLYHTGVERHWWQGPQTCTTGGLGDVSADQLLNQIMSAPLTQCDQVQWDLWGISMASWNFLFSALLCLIWLAALRATPRRAG